MKGALLEATDRSCGWTSVYQGKFKREGKVIQRNVIQRDDQNCDVLKIAEDS